MVVAEEPEDDMHLTRPWTRRVSFEPRSQADRAGATTPPRCVSIGMAALPATATPLRELTAKGRPQ
jgi:hypothetical protein